VIESNRPPAYRPLSPDNNALISVEDVVIKYAPELPPVLHGMTFALKAGERVGLLGRTGGHLFIYLFACVKLLTGNCFQVDPVNDRIVIGDIDISAIGVYDLRSRLFGLKSLHFRLFTLRHSFRK
jgi:ABC-type multidrug transport system fused ATPase/permease subunit